jgi:carboxyl-terminal processing protease
MMTPPPGDDRFNILARLLSEPSMPHLTRYILLALMALILLPAVAEQPPRSSAVSMEDVRAFTDAWGYIKDHYVDEIDDRQLLEAAIRGMLSELDSHSTWLDSRGLRGVEEQASGRYGGLGVRVGIARDHLEVVDTMAGSPAERAGLETGDRIIAINDTDLTETNAHEASEWLRGNPGSRVALTIEREGQSDVLEISLIRELIRRTSLTHERLPDGLVYVSINQFQQTTPEELDAVLQEFNDSAEPPAGLILDLRDNPGGMFDAAVAVADRFLSEQLIVSSEGRSESQNLELRANPGEILAGVPIVVLVNQRSASGAEILAGALQDHERAVILGETTYGKGSIQTIWPLRSGAGMRLTTAHYYTPSGRRIEDGGIKPDISATDYSGSLSLSSDHEERPDEMINLAMAFLTNAQRLTRISSSAD